MHGVPTDRIREAIDECANALSAAVLLAAEKLPANDPLRLSIERAARALAALKPGEK
jgi:hypothetical protein